MILKKARGATEATAAAKAPKQTRIQIGPIVQTTGSGPYQIYDKTWLTTNLHEQNMKQ